MCTISDWQRQPQVMKDELFEKIAGEIAAHAAEVIRVHLYRDGEPLLDKKLAPRVARLKQGSIREIGISTNGELFDETKARDILEAGLDEIIFSIDSIKKDVYEKIRVGLDFHTVMLNSKMLFYWRNRWNPKCRIRIRMIRQESNKEEWDSGAYQAQWNQFLSPGDTVECRDIHNWGGAISGHQFSGDTQRPCIALWSLCVIFADGTVPLCNVDYNAKFPLGNVRASSIAALWQSAEQEKRRAFHMAHDRKAISPCTNCTVWSEDAKRETPPLIIFMGECNACGFLSKKGLSAEELGIWPEVRILNNLTMQMEYLDMNRNNCLVHETCTDNRSYGWELFLAQQVKEGKWPYNPVYLVKGGQGGSKAHEFANNHKNFYTISSSCASAPMEAQVGEHRKVMWYQQGANESHKAPEDEGFKKNVVRLFDNIRNDLGTFPILMTGMLPHGEWQGDVAQQIAREGHQISCIDVTEPNKAVTDGQHWNKGGMQMIAEDFRKRTLELLS